MLNHSGKQKNQIIRLIGIFVIFCLAEGICAETKLIPRKILALYKGSENRTEEINETYQMAQLVLNNLGLVVVYCDAETKLPDIEKLSQYRGVLTWFVSDQMKNVHRYRVWLEQIINEVNLPVVILGHMGAYREYSSEIKASDIKAVTKLFASLGLKSALKSWASQNIKIEFQDTSIYDYETQISAKDLSYIYDIESINPENKVLFKLTDQKISNDAAILTRNGAYIQDGVIYKQDEKSGRIQWYLNPFKIFYETFACETLPMIDINTLGGKRTAFIHIDGDGFSTITKINHWHQCAEIFQQRIIKKYPLPYSVSIIAAEIDSAYMGDENTIKTAREIFTQPNVEPASHGFAHPFDWRTGQLELDSIPNFTFDPKIEINESIQYINDNLLQPGKFVNLFFWTGMCNQTDEHLKLVADLGIMQINGGAGKIDLNKPSISAFVPPYSQVKDQFRINARISNEYEFTNHWQGPHDGFKEVIVSLKFTDEMPLIPANIYFHLYSLEFNESFKALQNVIKFVRHQDWSCIYTSQYVRLVQDFLDAEILKLNSDEYYIQSSGYVRSIKFPQESRYIDLIKSENVLGYSHNKDYLIAHLDQNSTHRIVLSETKSQRPYLVTFNRMVDSFTTGSDTSMIKIDGYGNFRTKLKNFLPNSMYKIQAIGNLNAEEYKMINLKTNETKEKHHYTTLIVQSDDSGSLELETFIENRTIVLISPSDTFNYVLSKTKILLLGMVLVGFVSSQFILIRKRKGKTQF